MPADLGHARSIQEDGAATDWDAPRTGAASDIGNVLAAATACTLFLMLPVLMVIANKSAPFTLGLAAVLANAAALASGSASRLLARYRLVVRTSTAGLAIALAAWAVASLMWTIDCRATRRALIEALPELVAACGLAAAWPLVARARDFELLKFGLLAASALIVFEATAGMPLHRLVGTRAEDADLKRSAVPLVLMIWPAIEFHIGRNGVRWIILVACAVMVAALASRSSASVVAGIASIAVFVSGRIAPRATLWTAVAGAFAGLALAPWTGTLVQSALSPRWVELLSRQHADIRIGLWSNFERHIGGRLMLGHGFGASRMVATSAQLSHAADTPMAWNVHPHNVLLQVWVELGLVGACGAGVAMAFCMVRLMRIPDRARASRLAFAASAAVVALVGLYAWSPWGLATGSVCLVCFLVLRLHDGAPLSLLPGQAELHTERP